MVPSLQQVLNNAAARFSTIRTDLTIADVGMLGSSGVSKICATARATAYVWTSATLEVFVKSLLSAVLAEINAASVPRGSIRLSLHSILAHPPLTALQASRGLSISTWDERVRTFQDVDSASVVPFNTNIIPLDGRTLRAQHFETIWRVFGFRPPTLPQAVCGLALTDLAEGRNELAHGRTPAEVFVRQKTTAQVLRLLSLVEDVAEHLTITADDYLANRGYVR